MSNYLPPSARCQACGDDIDERNNCACPAGIWDEPVEPKTKQPRITNTQLAEQMYVESKEGV